MYNKDYAPERAKIKKQQIIMFHSTVSETKLKYDEKA